MLMKEFRKLIAPSAFLKIRSYYTSEIIKVCKAIELTEEDMQLNIDSIQASVYMDDDHKTYLGMFILQVNENSETHAKPIEDIRHLYPTELITGYKNE